MCRYLGPVKVRWDLCGINFFLKYIKWSSWRSLDNSLWRGKSFTICPKKVLQFVPKMFYNLSKNFFTICLSLNSRLALSTAAARPCHNFEIARIGIECPMYSWLADVNHQSSTNPRGTQPISTNKLKVPHHYHQTNMNPNQSNIKSSASTIRHYRLQNRNLQLCIFGGTCERGSIVLKKNVLFTLRSVLRALQQYI